VVGAVVCIPLILLAAQWAHPGSLGEHLGLRRPEAGSAVRWLLVLAAFIAAMDGTNWVLGRNIVPTFMREAYLTAGWLPLLWFALVIAAPVTEELLFRGLLFGGLAPSVLGVLGAAIVTSLVWAAIHIQYDLFEMGTIFLAGLLLAAARHSTRSVVLCIILHSAMNLVATVEALVALRME
jgi:membrane protease YdiL (CAAX protease family)